MTKICHPMSWTKVPTSLQFYLKKEVFPQSGSVLIKPIAPIRPMRKGFPHTAWLQARLFESGQSGFTLIELMVAVGVITLVTFLVMPNVSSYFHLSLNAATRNLSGAIHEAYASAVLRGRVYRVAYDLKENCFWAEVGPDHLLLEALENTEQGSVKKKFKSEEAPPAFSLATEVTRKKTPLPRGVVFADILTQRQKNPISKGVAYTHFFPNGFSEQTVIHLKDISDHSASLVLTPSLGITELYDRYVDRHEAFEQ